ncbi:hypothetical protein OAG82_01780 [Rubripirellula sp.]|nr:hypothetical protein [Rubripirellula sp.]MDB4621565.1 hypothetical protein [Rubripirellula sp.]
MGGPEDEVEAGINWRGNEVALQHYKLARASAQMSWIVELGHSGKESLLQSALSSIHRGRIG